jgi:DnaJ-class molecular chaperone
LQGKGQSGPNGGPPGDLYVQIKEIPHPLFRREDADLYLKQKIRFSQAVLGADIEVSTLEKKVLKLKIPPGTQNNAKFRLKNFGLPHYNGSGKGNAFVEINIDVPKELTDEQKDLVASLAKAEL